MSRTLVVFHAHPDDEALLTSGTMAKAAAAGHRVVLVVATDGDLGLAASSYRAESPLATVRLRELQASATALGVARTVHLGYADSGSGPELYADPPGTTRFARADVDEAAGRLAAILDEEDADVLLTYDKAGGYGHRDHVQVHHVGARAARLATRRPRVLEATVPRDLLVRGIRLVTRLRAVPGNLDAAAYLGAYSSRREITHRIRVYRQIGAKRASMRAHASQATSDSGSRDRTLGLFLRIPRPLYDLAFGHEWYIDPEHDGPVEHDVFAGLGDD